MTGFEAELSALSDALEGKVEEPKKEEVKEEVVEETKVEEVKEENSDGLQGKEEGKEEVVEVKEEVVKEEVKEVVEDKDAIINDLRAKLAKATKPTPEVKEEKVEPVKEEPLQFTEQNFVENLDLDEVSRDPKEFNKLLNKVYQQAFKDANKLSVESVLRSIPEIVRKNIEITNNLKKMHDDFYSANEDLKGFKKVVAVVFEEISSANQGKSYNELLKLTGPEVRKRLNLQKVVNINEKKEEKAPKLPSKGSNAGSLSTKPQTEGIQSEIETMMKSL